MNGKERILTALSVKQADRVPLYIHGINEAPIIGIGRHLTDGLPDVKLFRQMDAMERFKLLWELYWAREGKDDAAKKSGLYCCNPGKGCLCSGEQL